jgi:hypothetical protein
MARTAIVFGLLLIGVTVATIAYNGGFESKTVFFPSLFGVLIAGLGLVALKASLRKHAMHAASAVGLLGGLGCLGMGIGQIAKLGTEKAPTIDKLASVWSTAGLCLIFVVLCVQSFIRARRAK